MKVNISVPGTWHAFHLAEELDRREALRTIYTSYPRSRVDGSGVKEERIVPIWYPEALNYAGKRIPLLDQILLTVTPWNRPTARMKGRLFDRAVSRRIRNRRFDIFVGFAGVSLKSIQSANKTGATTIVERCSSHIRTQARLLQEEYTRHGIDWKGISDAHIRREECEYDSADFVTVPSTFVYDSFIEHDFPEEKLILQPYSVDVHNFTPRFNSGGASYYLFAGGVGIRKGIPDLLKAWDSLELEDAKLLIAGSVEPEVRELAYEYSTDDSVQFLGWVDEMAELYQKASAFVLPSIEEGSANVTYEAMASGLPIITTTHSGWVGEDGMHGVEVSIRNPAQLASEIERLHVNPALRREFGSNARNLIESKYTWDHYGTTVYSRYESLLDTHST